jgi:hypothetical protein
MRGRRGGGEALKGTKQRRSRQYVGKFRHGFLVARMSSRRYKPTRPTTHASQYKPQPTLSRAQLACLLYTFQTVIPSGDRFCVLGTCAGYKFGFKKKKKE